MVQRTGCDHDYPRGNLATLDGITAYCEYLKENNSEKYFTCFDKKSFFMDFMDIFISYGLYPSSGYPIGYNPLSGKFEDVLLDDGVIPILTQLKYLADNDMIILTNDFYRNEQDAEIDGVVASKYEAGAFTGTYFKEYSLFRENNENTVLVTPRNGAWVMLKDTPDLMARLKEFIQKIWLNQDARTDFNYGIESYNFTKNESFILIDKDAEGMNPFSSPYVMNIRIVNYKEDKKTYTEDRATEDPFQEYHDNNKLQMESISDIQKYYRTYTIDSAGAINARYQSIYHELFYNIFEAGMAVDQALDIYRAKASSLYESVIHPLNENIH